MLNESDPAWQERVCDEGFGSGEGVVWAVRDEVKTTKTNPKTGQPEESVQAGVDDKRLLVVEEEMAKALRLAKAKESLLASIIRAAFDRVPIGKLNKGESRYRCARPHVSIIGNIRRDELLAELHGTTHLANGFLNRFLICEARREKYIPRKGRWRDALAPFERPVADVLAFARGVGLLELDEEAGEVWDGLYQGLETRPDDVFGKATSRASDYVIKLALVYALLDRADAIRLPHLKAALAVWRYCEASAANLFGSQAVETRTPDPLWLSALNLIRARPGIGRGEIVYGLRHAGKADAVGKALEALREKGLAYAVTVQPEGGGRPKEQWYPGDPEGNQGVVNNNLSPSRVPVSVSGSWVVRSEEKNPEETNSLTGTSPAELVSSELAGRRGGEVVDTQSLPPQDSFYFGAGTPVPEGWLDGRADAALIERIWPVPKGWHRHAHGIGWLHDVDERGVSGRNVFNPAWPVVATVWGEGVEHWEKLMDEDPDVYRVIQPQPLAP